MLTVLFLGDIVGSRGRSVLRDHLARIKQEFGVNYTIANAENAAGGNGLTRSVALELFDMGIDVLTGGNHIWDKREILDFIDDFPRILRPYNYPPGTPGSGLFVTEVGSPPRTLAVANLMGRAFMPPIDCPYRAFDELYDALPPGATLVVDFHAEATSEKVAMAYYADGRAGAVIGTHTHIQTADERVMPAGTLYITDAGMCGPREAVLGVDKETVLRKFITGLPVRFEVPEKGAALVCGVVLQLPADGSATVPPIRINRIYE